MSIKLNITRGVIQRPQKVVIYGPEGIGKTSLASKFPAPLFIDTEGGSAHLDVARIECRQSWQELIETVKAVAEQDVCKTLIIDTADWAEQLAVEHLCKKYNQPSIESFGYGKITNVEGQTCEVEFEKFGRRKIMGTYLRRA